MVLSTTRADGGIDYLVVLTREQRQMVGRDGALMVRHLDTALTGLAALRSGLWAAGSEAEREPGAAEWASVIGALAALRELSEAVMAAAVREHAAAGGTVGALGDAMGVAKGTAQNRRQAWIGTRDEPVAPAGPELWARGVGQPPA